jgi:TonB family protein
MTKREKFGKFVLLEQVDTSPLATEHRAAKLGATGLEKVVSVHRLTTQLAANADVAKSLRDQIRFASQLQNPNVLKIYEFGLVDSSYYISYEFMEGKSLKAIFSRCRQDGFPFSVDHALVIVSKLCSALEYAHGRKSETGSRYFHGLVCPANVLVSYEGEVRLRGFGYWPSRIRETRTLFGDDARYLAPEQAAGAMGDTRSDVFSLGAILFETLTGEPLRKGEGPADVPARLAQARLQSPTTDEDAMPKPIAAILQRALAVDPASRYAEVQEMRKAIDTLLFSGDFTPTTFNLAFFMHSLFREDIEQESKLLKEEKEASYAEYVAAEAATLPPDSLPAAALAAAMRTDTQALRPAAAVDETTIVPSPLREPAPVRQAVPASPPVAAGLGAKAAASGFTFHRDEAKGSRLPLIAGVAGVLLVLVVVGAVVLRRAQAPAAPSAPAPSTLSAEAVAAQAKVKELQEKLAALEAEKAAAETKAAEDAKKKIEAQAAAKGQVVDPAALARAQEDARKKVQAEQEKRAQEEKQKLEAEKAAEEARLAEEKRKTDEEAARVAAATTTLPAAAPPTTVAPATQPGSLVNLADAGVIAPLLERKGTLQYPPIALRQRVEGTVELNVLVDEKGGVTDAKVVTGVGGRSGLNEAAIDYARRQRYRPATKEGIPVKVWMPLRVKFELPKR